MSKTIKVTVPSHVLLTVVRPNGEMEVVRHPTLKSLLDHEFKVIKKMTKEAGRGDVISYENVRVDDEVVLTDADIVGIESDKLSSAMAYGEER